MTSSSAWLAERSPALPQNVTSCIAQRSQFWPGAGNHRRAGIDDVGLVLDDVQALGTQARDVVEHPL
ncbi:MAG: hypothetical protein KDB13_04705, partial [Microthrixaceae bacterium]|nr:hypothetical protein [Microthrixaceae bacterium]